MDFNFVYLGEMKKVIKGSTAKDADPKGIKAIYSWSPDEMILLNLGAEQFKKRGEMVLDDVCNCLHHEYLHKEISNIRGELGLSRAANLKEEEIVAKTVGQPFDKEDYKDVIK